MARIPVQYTKEITAMPPMPSVQTDIAPIAKGIDFIGQAIGIRAERQREADEQMRKIDVDKEFAAMQTNAKKSKSGSALGLNKEFADRYTPLYEKYVDEIEDPVTRKNMESYFQSKYNRGVDWTRNYVMGEEDAHLAEVDEANRANLAEELSETQIGDLESIFAAADKAVMDVTKREGVQRMTSERQALYHKKALNELFTTQLDRWYSVDPLDTYNWYAQNREKLRDTLSAETFAASEKAFRSQHSEAQTVKAYRHAMTKFGDDYIRMEAYLSDPGNWADMGFRDSDYAYPMAAAARIRQFRTMQESSQAQIKEENWNTTMEGFNERQTAFAQIEDPAEKFEEYNNMLRYVQESPDIPFEKRGTLINQLNSANFTDNPMVHNEIRKGIDSGEITTYGQIQEFKGLGAGENIDDHKKYLDSKRKNDRFGNINYFNKALTLRKDLDSEVRQAFRERLEAEQRRYNLNANDPQLLDIADKLLTKEQFKKTDEGEKVWDKGGAGEWLDQAFTWGEEERFRFQSDRPLDMPGIATRGEAQPQGQWSEPQPQGQTVTGSNPVELQKAELSAILDNPASARGDTVEEKIEHTRQLVRDVLNRELSQDEVDDLFKDIMP